MNKTTHMLDCVSTVCVKDFRHFSVPPDSKFSASDSKRQRSLPSRSGAVQWAALKLLFFGLQSDNNQDSGQSASCSVPVPFCLPVFAATKNKLFRNTGSGVQDKRETYHKGFYAAELANLC